MRPRMEMLLRLWQSHGGLPRIADLLGHPISQEVYRSSSRTLIVGNPGDGAFTNCEGDVSIDLNSLLWRSESSAFPVYQWPGSPKALSGDLWNRSPALEQQQRQHRQGA